MRGLAPLWYGTAGAQAGGDGSGPRRQPRFTRAGTPVAEKPGRFRPESDGARETRLAGPPSGSRTDRAAAAFDTISAAGAGRFLQVDPRVVYQGEWMTVYRGLKRGLEAPGRRVGSVRAPMLPLGAELDAEVAAIVRAMTFETGGAA